MKTTNFIILLGVVGIVGYYLIKKGANAINPLSQTNIANTGATAAYQALTGSTGTIGSDLYNALNPYNPNGTAAYFVYDANGNLVRDSSGELKTTTYPPGTPQNPYPNPNG